MTRVFKFLILLTGLATIFGCQSETTAENTAPALSFDPLEYVDPYIGTDYHGHVFLGANVPFGAVQVGPTNFTRGWDWCSGYHDSDSVMIGFAQTHLSGTGIGDLGDVMLMPYTGPAKTNPGTQEAPFCGYADLYSQDQEIAEAGYYQVKLLNNNITVDLTASKRVGFHKYTFPKAEEAHIAVDIAGGIGWDDAVEGAIKKIDDQTVVGHRFSKGWAKDQRLFYAIKLSKPMKGIQLVKDDAFVDGTELTDQYDRA